MTKQAQISVVCFIVVGLMGLLRVIAAAEPVKEKPTSATAKAAAAELDRAIKKADDDRHAAVLAAKKKYSAALQSELAKAMKATNLDEANRINAAKKEIDASIQAMLRGEDQGQKVLVDAARDWQRVRDVAKGERIYITATGTVCVNTNARDRQTFGPDGTDGVHPNPTHNGALVGRIGNTKFEIGPAADFMVPADGVLELCVYDTGPRNDNDGAFSVIIVGR